MAKRNLNHSRGFLKKLVADVSHDRSPRWQFMSPTLLGDQHRLGTFRCFSCGMPHAACRMQLVDLDLQVEAGVEVLLFRVGQMTWHEIIGPPGDSTGIIDVIKPQPSQLDSRGGLR